MFYELLTGRKPFIAESPMEMFNLHISGTFERPSRVVLDVPVWLDTLVVQLMEKDPNQRPFSARAVGEALARVREKVEAQQSAGVDLVHSRAVDRKPGRAELDDQDKAAARTLLGKKKRKKKARPFYQTTWFRIAGLAGLLVAVCWVFYTVFLKPPNPEALYAQAKALMNTPDLARWREARDGPVRTYLRYYGNSQDEHLQKMQKWADEVDLRDTEQAMYTRWRKGFDNGEPGYATAFKALDNQGQGQLAEARKEWESLKKFQSDPDNRGWALVADRYLKELGLVDRKERELNALIVRGEAMKQPYKADNPEEQPVVEVLRAEIQGRSADALKGWRDLKAELDRTESPRWYHFLAAARVAAGKASETTETGKQKTPDKESGK
jgi:serine/threonine-protein kinase